MYSSIEKGENRKNDLYNSLTSQTLKMSGFPLTSNEALLVGRALIETAEEMLKNSLK